jgi:DNA-binding HxlR family transcriptional regulator
MSCPVDEAVQLLSGRWRLMVLFRLEDGPMRFNALQRSLHPITQKMLAATLRNLEADGLVWRKSEATVPPNVSYGLTKAAEGLSPVFEALARWKLATEDAVDQTRAVAL